MAIGTAHRDADGAIRQGRSALSGLARWKPGGSFPPSAILAAAVLIFLVGLPLFVLLRVSFTLEDGSLGLGNFVAAYSSTRQLGALWNTFVLGAVVSLVAVVLALPLAWAVSRTDIGGKRFIHLSSMAVFICPPYLNAVAWIFLAGPNAGLLNTLWSSVTGTSAPVFNIFSFAGIAFVMGTSLFCFVFTFTVSALDMVSSEMEEAAAILGSGRWRTATHITLPLVTPAILSAVVIVFLQSIALYGVPALLAFPARYPVLVTSLMEYFEVMPVRVGVATAYTMPLVVVTVGVVALQRLQTRRRSFVALTGKGGQRRPMKLGVWRAPLTLLAVGISFIVAILPMLVLVQAAFSKTWARGLDAGNLTFDNFLRVLEYPGMRDAVLRSLGYALASALLTTAVAVGVAYLVVRRKILFGFMFSLLAMIPYIIPAIVLSIGYYATFSAPPLSLYGTGLLLILAFTARFLPISYASATAGLTTLNPEMEDAARILGASRHAVLLRITMPLMKKSIIASSILVFILASHELSTAVFLSNHNNRVVSVAMLDFADNGQMEYVAAMGVVLLLVTILIAAAGMRAVGRDFMLGKSSS